MTAGAGVDGAALLDWAAVGGGFGYAKSVCHRPHAALPETHLLCHADDESFFLDTGRRNRIRILKDFAWR